MKLAWKLGKQGKITFDYGQMTTDNAYIRLASL
ncbi:hypothetical protein NIES23_24180 [Trichormus variabilis NIES-23]|uniref:Uncharacterized protein n=1 Tax=Trichormus variabilis NIES-23 TaxID=1973479 RepID=A0A1Z4KL64_ANAVA|nr:hypothetical protein NIES23_24180 [Trichormus variabilis NIES-23]